ncbi:MAG: hypothetical protein K2X84_12610, partial [Beijerinckiaceae bacterium]|nr:hypothetical protein [Beijerinckiaceae bacterium]
MMAATGPDASVAGRSAWDRRGSTLLAMLGVGILVQTVIAVVWGAAPGSRRDAWPVALSLGLMLSLSSAGLLWAVWRARDMPTGLILGLAIAAA